MNIEYRKATLEDAELLINIYNASFYNDYLRYGSCPEYGKTKEMIEELRISEIHHTMRQCTCRLCFVQKARKVSI